jgi:hypothetical protein
MNNLFHWLYCLVHDMTGGKDWKETFEKAEAEHVMALDAIEGEGARLRQI